MPSSVRMVPPGEIPAIWDDVMGKVSAALEYGDGCYRVSDVRKALQSGQWQLWMDDKSIACTRIAEYPSRRMLFVMLAEGELPSVFAMWPAMRRFGEQNGCTGAKWMGRPGWKRSGVLPEGFRHTHDIVTVEF